MTHSEFSGRDATPEPVSRRTFRVGSNPRLYGDQPNTSDIFRLAMNASVELNGLPVVCYDLLPEASMRICASCTTFWFAPSVAGLPAPGRR